MTMADTIIAAARTWLGTPYHHQASMKGVGCDCLGLIRGLYRELVGPEPVTLPVYTRDWGDATGAETLLEAGRTYLVPLTLDEAAPGDVAVFRLRAGAPAKHAGVLMAEGRMIHAQEGDGVVEIALGRWWRRHLTAAFRFPQRIA
jgi:NlpC/P60 family putative phage cell wall peptidase